MMVVPLGVALAKVNPCPPQQQPTGDITVCERGGEGGPGGGSGGQSTGSIDFDAGQFSLQQRGGGANPGDATGGGGGNRSIDLTFDPSSGDFSGHLEAAGGNSETGGGHCGATLEGGDVTDEFAHGKSCPPIF
jgi:hypothetical protein